MNEIVRAAVIVGVVTIALAAAWWRAAHGARSRRNSIRTESLRPWPAVVLFTSSDCDACDPARNIVVGSVPGDVVREIAYQGSADQFRSVGIDKVPAVVVIDGRGVPVGVYEGRVTSRRVGWALRRAGIR